WSLAIACLVLGQGDLLLRISDVRTDQVAILFALLAVLSLLGERVPAFLAGLLYGTGVNFSVKMAVALPAFLVLVPSASSRRRATRTVAFAFGSAVGWTAGQATRALTEGLDPVVAGIRSLFGGGGVPATAGPLAGDFARRVFGESPVGCLLVLLGLAGFV